MNLSVNVFGQHFANPLVVASGILGVTGGSMGMAVANGAGGVTGKSLHVQKRFGHRNPTVLATEHFMINAVGLSGEGIEEGLLEHIEFKQQYPNTPLIASFFGTTIDEYEQAAILIDASPAEILEVNISCPNIEDEGRMFAASPESTAAITKIVRRHTKKPVVVKISPAVDNIVVIAKAAEAAGADGICAINTYPGLVIDADFRKPILTNKIGGLSGPALKPIALRCVWQIAQNVKIPIIGTGGVTTGRDAIEMIMAGASLVGVGTAVHYRGADVFAKINAEMMEWCEKEGVKSLEEIRGAALPKKS